MKHKILIVDDEHNMRRILEAMLRREGYNVVQAEDGETALRKIEENDITTVVTDLKMPGMDGLSLLSKIMSDSPEIPVIIITAHGTIETAVNAMKSGAFDYVTKPFEQDEMKMIVRKAVRAAEYNRLEIHPESGLPTNKYHTVGESRQIKEIHQIIDKVAASPTTVLIRGESGTGKELIAQAIHENSPRNNNPFIKLNCAAIPENLLESELFGYEKGAFTGAVTSKPGKFELADGGSLFLDEVGEIPREMQVKLLRVLQNQEFERVGGIRTIKVDVRIIAATNRDLERDVDEGRFRQELYYRLNIVPIALPPLRQRTEDIPLLVNHFILKLNRKLGRNVKDVSPNVLKALMNYHWPGNIRELENVMERAVLMTDNTTLELSDFPPNILETSGGNIPDISFNQNVTLKEAVKETTEQVEKSLIIKILKKMNGNVTRSAQELGISRKSLQMKMKEYGLRDIV